MHKIMNQHWGVYHAHVKRNTWSMGWKRVMRVIIKDMKETTTLIASILFLFSSNHTVTVSQKTNLRRIMLIKLKGTGHPNFCHYLLTPIVVRNYGALHMTWPRLNNWLLDKSWPWIKNSFPCFIYLFLCLQWTGQ